MFGNKSAGLHEIVTAARLSDREKQKKNASASWVRPTQTRVMDASLLRETYFALMRPIRGVQ